jgi:hypothetical protein
LHNDRFKHEAWRLHAAEMAPSERRGEVLLKGGAMNVPARLYDGRAGGPNCEQPDDRREAMRDEEGAAAKTALRSFLAGFGVGPEQGVDLLMERLLPGAAARCRAQPEESAATSAVLHAEEAFEAWLTAVLGAEELGGQPALPIGRAAFLACGGPARWPDLILVQEPLPEAFVAAMRAAAPLLAPMPTPGTMATQSLESWTIGDAGRAVVEVLDAHAAWLGHSRPLITVPIKIAKTSP